MPARITTERAGRVLATLLIACALASLGGNVYFRAVHSPAQQSDFIIFHMAAQAMLHGEDVYSVRHPRGWEFYYPPGMPALLAPLALMPLPIAVVAWYLLSVAAMLRLGYVLDRLCRELAGWPFGWLVVFAFFANFGPLVSGTQRGQISVLLAALMAEAFWAYRRGRTGLAGAWIGLAASVKVYPALLLFPLLLRREWRGLAGFALVAALVSVALPMTIMGPIAGWQTCWRFASGVLGPLAGSPAAAQHADFADITFFAASNQSLFGMLGRWLCRGADAEPFAWSVAALTPAAARAIAQGISLVLLMLTAAVTLRGRDRRDWREAALWGLLMLLGCFASPFAWHHYYAVLTFVYAVVGTRIFGVAASMFDRLLLGATQTIAMLSSLAYFASDYVAGGMILRQAGLLAGGSLLLWLAVALICLKRSLAGGGAAEGQVAAGTSPCSMN